MLKLLGWEEGWEGWVPDEEEAEEWARVIRDFVGAFVVGTARAGDGDKEEEER